MEFLSRKHFEILKGIAIVLVLISHIGNFSGVTWFTPLGGIGVAIFLFCSGYSHAYSYSAAGLKNFWKKKFVNVYFTYFIIEVFFSLILQRPFMAIVLDLLLIKPAYTYGWYMQYLFCCYLIFWLGCKFISSEKTRITIFVTLAFSSFFVFSNLRAEQAFSFVGGIITFMLVKKKAINFKHGTSIAILLAILSVALLAIKQFPVVRQQSQYLITLLNLLLKSFAAASIIYLTYSVNLIKKISTTIFPFWGRISYVFYLLHGYFIFVVSQNLFGSYLINSLVCAVIATASSIVVNFVIQKLTPPISKTFGLG